MRWPSPFPEFPRARWSVWLRRRPRAQLVLCAILALLVGLAVPLPAHFSPKPPPADQQALATALNQIRTIEFRPRILGYSRQRFGQGWGSHATSDGRYCTTRQLLVQAAFSTDASTDSPSPKECGIREQRGVGPKDPYTGEEMSANHVDVDHIVPLSAAWDLGAYGWDEPKRLRFANDMRWNLVVVDSTVNRDKSDSTLSDWMPPAASARCPYAARFVAVVARYGLSLPESDAKVARQACGL